MFKLIPPSGHKLYLRDLLPVKTSLIFEGIFFNSGTSALYFLIKNLNIPANSRIIIPAYTCPTVAAAVIKAGHQPVLSDNNSANFGYDDAQLEKKINEHKPAAIIKVNLFGLKSSIPDFNLPIIVDNAQSNPFDSVAENASCQVFSFGRGKPVNSNAGGLAVIQKESDFSDICNAVKGIKPTFFFFELKYLLNLIAFMVFFNPQVYKLLYSLPFLNLGETIYNQNFRIRKALKLNKRVIKNILSRYEKISIMRQFVSTNYTNMLNNYKDQLIYFPNIEFYRYPVLLKDIKNRDLIIRKLQSQGIGAFPLYPVPLNRQPILCEILNDKKLYPIAEFISKGLFTLPVNEFVNERVISETHKVFNEFL